MDIRDIKKSLNREVLHDGQKYLFVGCILRRHKKENRFYYEAELHDPRNLNWEWSGLRVSDLSALSRPKTNRRTAETSGPARSPALS